MITPNQIKEKKLSTAVNGYDINETNAFIEEIAQAYAAVCAENKELYRKMEILANKIVEYRAEEDTIKEALISAQKTAGEITKSAKEKAEKLISDARDYVAKLTKEKTDVANAIATEAQEKADGILSNAKTAASDIMNQVKETSQELITKAKEEKERHESIVSTLKSESAAFKASLVSLYEQELKRLKELKDGVIDLATPAEKLDEIAEELGGIETPAQEEPVIAEEPAPQAETAEEIVEEIIEATETEEAEIPEQAEEIAEEAEVAEIEEVEEIEEIEEIAEVEEIEEIEELTDASGSASMIDVDIASAINAFTADEITPIEGYPVREITEEPEMEPAQNAESDELPFESFFNVKTPNARTDEKLSLIPPEDFEVDDEDDDLKFRGFFKKKKK